MSGHKQIVWIALTTVALVLAACAGTAVPTAKPPTETLPTLVLPDSTLDMTPAQVRYGDVTGVALPTLIVAEGQGFFALEHITLEKFGFNGTGPVSDALAAGNLDVGVTSPAPSILATIKGAKTIMVSGYENSFIEKTGKAWEPLYVIVRSGEGIKKLTDLKGKRAAVSDIGSYSNFALRAVMLENKIDPDKDMTIIAIPYTQQPGALMQKQVDAILTNADGYLLAQKMGQVEYIATHTSLLNLDMDASSTVGVNTDFLHNKPDVVVRFLRAFLRARQWMADDVARNDGKNMMDLVARAMKYTPEQAQSFYQMRAGYYGKELERINLLDIPTRSINRYYDILKVNGYIQADVPVDYPKTVDIRPLKQAYASLGLVWDESKH